MTLLYSLFNSRKIESSCSSRLSNMLRLKLSVWSYYEILMKMSVHHQWRHHTSLRAWVSTTFLQIKASRPMISESQYIVKHQVREGCIPPQWSTCRQFHRRGKPECMSSAYSSLRTKSGLQFVKFRNMIIKGKTVLHWSDIQNCSFPVFAWRRRILGI